MRASNVIPHHFDNLVSEYHFHQTYVTGHNCMVGDQGTMNTQTSTINQR